MTRGKYIYHVTIDNGHTRRSPRSEVRQETINIFVPWVKNMLNGQPQGIIDDKYSCRAEMHNSKMCEFVISRLTDDMAATDVIRFVVCRHSRHKQNAWALVSGVGEPPEVPFCAVKFEGLNLIDDLEHIGEFGDFERCVAWTWMEIMEAKK
ncbi:Uncharacterised protein [Actinobacillus pleuropneumoniae]|uniref:lactate dehydrogenase n=1 Tax=Actinobacillus pleuropneumoniae TaxID=715 RepID=UPI000DA3D31D|nr:Uncharacterised protein [Actinobacillus pleuropneumoniae]